MAVAIRCGSCGGTHASVAEVRQCHQGSAAQPSMFEPAADPAPVPVPSASQTLGGPVEWERLAGPSLLGRGLVVEAGAPVPAPWAGAPRVPIDQATLRSPTAAVAQLRHCWHSRQRVVVELSVGVADMEASAPVLAWHELGPEYEVELEALHQLVWANSIDGRHPDEPVWSLATAAEGLGACWSGPADLALPGGEAVYLDGGPIGPIDGLDYPVVHRVFVERGSLMALGPNHSDAELAPDQLAAVTHPGGSARIIAPAGSGKTRVLTERARLLVTRWGVPAGAIALVAFNKRAQEEMTERLQGVAGLNVRTLNSLALAIVNGDEPFASQPRRFRTIDERGMRDILSRLVQMPRKTNTDPAASWIEALGVARLGLVSPSEVEKRYGDDTPGFAAVHDRYREALAVDHLLDFDEQIVRAVELLVSDRRTRLAAQKACRLLLVDEFQDLRPAHLLLVRLLAGPDLAVFGVGDDDQTIYGYNGADPRWLIDFATLFPGAGDHPLEVNYRCPGGVVRAADFLVQHNGRRVPKVIRSASADPGGYCVRDDGDPLTTVVGAVTDAIESGRSPAEVAVLARVTAMLVPVQVALAQRSIPFRAAVGREFLERPGPRSALAWLRLAGNPGDLRPEDLREALRRPNRSVSPRVSDWVCEQRNADALRRLAGRITDERNALKVEQFADSLDDMVRVLSRGTAAALDVLFSRVGLAGALNGLDRDRRGMNQAAQADDLEALRQLATLHSDPSTFAPWLGDCLSSRSSAQGVTLATVHRVKGQEWPVVVVHAVDANQFPHRLATDREEERRVFHVAITRARDQLVLVPTDTPSPFIEELLGPPAVAPSRDPAAPRRAPAAVTPTARGGQGVTAVVGMVLVDGGQEWTIESLDDVGSVTRRGTVTRRFDYGRRVRTSSGRQGPLAAPADTDDAAMLLIEERLRLMRHQLRDGKPAYTVFPDSTLVALARQRPTTREGLLRVEGIGPARADRYGEAILAALRDP